MSTEAQEQMQFCNHKGIYGLLNVYGCKTRQGKGNSAESRQSAFSHSRRHTVIPGRHHFQHIGGMKLCGSCGEHQEGRKLARENKRGVFCAILLSCEAAKDLYFILHPAARSFRIRAPTPSLFFFKLTNLANQANAEGQLPEPYRGNLCAMLRAMALVLPPNHSAPPFSTHLCSAQTQQDAPKRQPKQERKFRRGAWK